MAVVDKDILVLGYPYWGQNLSWNDFKTYIPIRKLNMLFRSDFTHIQLVPKSYEQVHLNLDCLQSSNLLITQTYIFP